MSNNANDPSRNGIAATMDRSPIGYGQWLTAGLIILALTLDGLDLQLLGIVAPFLIADLNITREVFAPALAAAVLGLAIGSSIGGWFGDRFGSKRILLVSMAFFGLMTILSSFITTIGMLMAVRFVSGLAFGAATPNGLALGSEWLPRRAHPIFSAIASICTPLGGLIGAGLTLFLIPVGGWRMCFLVCGVLTLIATLVMSWRLPDSPAHLRRHGRLEQIRHLGRKVLGTDIDAGADDRPAEASGADRPRGRLFTAPLARMNVGTPIGFFSIAFVTYTFLSWTPVMLTMSGFTMAEAIRGSISYNMLALFAPLCGGLLISRFGSRAVLIGAAGATMLILVALATLLESGRHIGSTPLTWAVLAGFGMLGGLAGIVTAAIYSVLTNGWPVECRASGMGFGFMMGRIGGFTAILTSGKLLGLSDHSVLPVFLTALVALLFVIIAALVVDRHVPARQRAVAAP
ncbi:MAG: hypothetical protein ABS87_01425 [Sphingomonas sp. SCN 67-18]|nr:MFS transporter [Sphingomonas sp. SCN 67-18]ODU22667.1 MAG: hypothetical protein ABS87_01425 [Sphingomonas sp. SCN 67-18]